MSQQLRIIAENIKSLLHEFSLNQTEFGEKAGINQTVVSRFLGEKFPNPTLETLESIVKPFGKSITWLLTDHSEEAKYAAMKEASKIEFSQKQWDAIHELMRRSDYSNSAILERINHHIDKLDPETQRKLLAEWEEELSKQIEAKTQLRQSPTQSELMKLIATLSEKEQADLLDYVHRLKNKDALYQKGAEKVKGKKG